MQLYKVREELHRHYKGIVNFFTGGRVNKPTAYLWAWTGWKN